MAHHFSIHIHHTYLSIFAYMVGTTISQIASAYGLNHRHWLSHLNIALLWLWIGCIVSLYGLHIHTFSWMCLGRFLQGVGSGASYLLPFILIQHRFDYEASRPFYAYTNFAFAFWPYLAIFIGGHITYSYGIATTLISFAIYATFVTALTHFTSIRDLKCPSVDHTTFVSRVKKLSQSKRVIYGALGTGGLSSALYLYLSISPHLAFESLHFNTNHYGSWQMISGITAILGHSYSVFQAKRLNAMRLLKQALLIAIIALLSLWFVLIGKHWVTPMTFFMLPSLLVLVAPLVFSNIMPLATKKAEYKIEANMMMTFSNQFFTLVCLAIIVLSTHFSLFSLILAITLCWCFIALAILKLGRIERPEIACQPS